VLVCGHDSARSVEFAKQASSEVHGIPITPVNARTCASESDVLCACTSSPTPLFDGHDVRPGTHINLVGAFRPQTREADTHTIQRSRVVVDCQTLPLREVRVTDSLAGGAITRDHVAADLHELVSGTKQGRRSTEEVTVFKSVGCALRT
jgi:ornithine cyclodeaminase